ncbi:Multidrug resistance-associated protein 1, partial [Kappamyces sp. JEL0680]
RAASPSPLIVNPTLWEMTGLFWLQPLFRDGISGDRLPRLHASSDSAALEKAFAPYWDELQQHWKDPEKNKKPSLLQHVLRVNAPYLCWSGTCYLLSHVSDLVRPILIGQMIDLVSGYETSLDGKIVAALLFLLQLLAIAMFGVTNGNYWLLPKTTTIVLTTAIYKKLFRLSTASQKKYSDARIINLINQDIPMAINGSDFLFGIITPIQIGLSCCLLYVLIGATALATIGVIVVIFIFSTWMGILVARFMVQYRESSDKRIGAIREMVQGIKVVKLRVMESQFYDKIAKARFVQLAILYKYWIASSTMKALSLNANIVAAIVTFSVYHALGFPMKPSIVIPALGYMDMSASFSVLTYSISAGVEALTGLKNIAQFLEEEEFVADQVTAQVYKEAKFSISIEAGTEWKYEDENAESDAGPEQKKAQQIGFSLRATELNLDKGILVGISGKVGAGKSSLLAGLLGEMTLLSGHVKLNGRVAYCPQEPWIMKGSVQDNIIFGLPLDSNRLSTVLEQCGLVTDLSRFPDGVITEIGENGVNLSGGQKARVSLARALYSDADILLLDDPLSSCDSRVSRLIFDQLKQHRQNKTILMVTHSYELLSQMDYIISIEPGLVAETGSFQELASANGAFSALMKTYMANEGDAIADESSEDGTLQDSVLSSSGASVEAFVVKESQEKGGIKTKYYKSAFYPVRKYLPLMLLLLLWSMVSAIGFPLWLALWTSSVDAAGNDTIANVHLNVFILLGISTALSGATLYCVFVLLGVRISQYFHNESLKGMMRSTMYYFDTNPVGRILNLFSADMRLLDVTFANNIGVLTSRMVELLSILVLICYLSPYLILLFLVITAFLVHLQRTFTPVYLDVRRFRSTFQSPLDAHVNESINGKTIIKAYGCEQQFQQSLYHHLNTVEALSYTYFSMSNWFEVRSTAACALLTLTLSVVGLLANKSETFGALIGIGLVYVSKMVFATEQFLLNSSVFQISMNAVERMDRYRCDLPSEAPSLLDSDPLLSEWPASGALDIKDLVVSYEQKPDIAILKGISLAINAGEKIGICGRSGCGKSTLVSALFRLVERKSGSIAIDGQDVAELGLSTLRSRLQIIPQDPILFEGSVRSNLGTAFSDQELWTSLEQVGLKEYVASLGAQLDAPMAVNGTNFSFGQRQLLCMARAILARPKILVMDEATASVDGASDERIQAILKESFGSTTVLSVAHRLNSIADFDRVVVMDAGQVLEFDHPHLLLSNPASAFAQLVAASGAQNAQTVAATAKAAYEKTLQ